MAIYSYGTDETCLVGRPFHRLYSYGHIYFWPHIVMEPTKPASSVARSTGGVGHAPSGSWPACLRAPAHMSQKKKGEGGGSQRP